MASAAVDHLLSLTIFLAALLIFIGVFTQSMQTGISHQLHNSMSTKNSDLLDNLLLNPGLPMIWGQTDSNPLGLGLQDPEFTQYRTSSYSPMRLASSQTRVYYSTTDAYYSSAQSGYGTYLLVPTAKAIDYSTAAKLLGVNDTYGFQLTLEPTVTFAIQKTSIGSPLTFQINVAGTGYPLANAPLTYSLLLVNQGAGQYPQYSVLTGSNTTDPAGFAQLTFPTVNGENQAYALVVYSYLDGLKGVGYFVHVPDGFSKNVVPLIDSFQTRSIRIVHGDTLGVQPPIKQYSQLTYNATFVIRTEEYFLRPVILNEPNATGTLTYGEGSISDWASLPLPDNEGILIVTYKDSGGQCGVALMPWGLGSLAFPLVFGGDPAGRDWVTTDLRQVTIGGIAYQAKLALWNQRGSGSVIR